jgi:RNA polymerase sigma-70 factor (ECF subfamily)
MTEAMGRGSEEAFNAFYDAYFPRLYRYLLVLAGGREEEVKDAMQETMIRVIRNTKPFQEEPALWNWLRRVAKTALIDRVRKEKRRDARFTLSSFVGDRPEESADESPILLEHLSYGLERLEKEDRKLIEGKYLGERSYEDLAREQRCTAKAVESRLGRIRKKLKALILERMSHE